MIHATPRSRIARSSRSRTTSSVSLGWRETKESGVELRFDDHSGTPKLRRGPIVGTLEVLVHRVGVGEGVQERDPSALLVQVGEEQDRSRLPFTDPSTAPPLMRFSSSSAPSLTAKWLMKTTGSDIGPTSRVGV